MSNHSDNIAEINKLIAFIGEEEFRKCLKEIREETVKNKQINCLHDWKLFPIAGDGYTCFKCKRWKPEEN